MSANVKVEVEQVDEINMLPDEKVLFNNDVFGIIKQESDESRGAKVTRHWEDQNEEHHADASEDFSRARLSQISVENVINGEPKPIKIFKCAQCDHTSIRKSNLRKHMLIHNGTKNSRSIQCDLATNYKSSFTKHQSTPRPTHSATFYCTSCDYTTKIAWNFRKHLLTHKTIIPKIPIASYYQPNFTKFNCTSCDYRTNTEWDFKLHLITHKTILPKKI